MSEVTAKVTDVLSCRKWEGQHGTMFYYKLEMDNGDIGEIGKKKEDAFHIGDSLTYTVEVTDHGKKFKAVQPNGFGGKGGGFARIPESDKFASFALAYAKDVVIAYKEAIPAEKVAEATIKVADKFKAWLDANK